LNVCTVNSFINLFSIVSRSERMKWESRDLENPSAINVAVSTGQVTVWLEHRLVQVNHSLALTQTVMTLCATALLVVFRILMAHFLTQSKKPNDFIKCTHLVQLNCYRVARAIISLARMSCHTYSFISTGVMYRGRRFINNDKWIIDRSDRSIATFLRHASCVWKSGYTELNSCGKYSVSQKTTKLWNGIARNYMDRFWWYLAEIFKRL